MLFNILYGFILSVSLSLLFSVVCHYLRLPLFPPSVASSVRLQWFRDTHICVLLAFPFFLFPHFLYFHLGLVLWQLAQAIRLTSEPRLRRSLAHPV